MANVLSEFHLCRQKWEDFGLQSQRLEYEIMLSYPDDVQKNLVIRLIIIFNYKILVKRLVLFYKFVFAQTQITIDDGDGTNVFTSRYREQFEEGDIDEEADAAFVDGFLAYAPNGNRISF